MDMRIIKWCFWICQGTPTWHSKASLFHFMSLRHSHIPCQINRRPFINVFHQSMCYHIAILINALPHFAITCFLHHVLLGRLRGCRQGWCLRCCICGSFSQWHFESHLPMCKPVGHDLSAKGFVARVLGYGTGPKKNYTYQYFIGPLLIGGQLFGVSLYSLGQSCIFVHHQTPTKAITTHQLIINRLNLHKSWLGQHHIHRSPTHSGNLGDSQSDRGF